LITLQNQLESKSLEATTASSSLDKVKASYGAMKIRYEEMMVNLASVKEELATNESQFSNEISSMRRLVEMMEKREVERKARMEDVERALEEDRGETVAIEEEWKAELERERERSDALEEKCSELREALEQSVNGVSGRSNYIEGSPTASSGGLLALNQSAQGAVRLQKTGRSYAQVYSEYVKMQEDLANERAETKRLGEILSQILLDIEERVRLAILSLPVPTLTSHT
jgi:nucleoprotein TPR